MVPCSVARIWQEFKGIRGDSFEDEFRIENFYKQLYTFAFFGRGTSMLYARAS